MVVGEIKVEDLRQISEALRHRTHQKISRKIERVQSLEVSEKTRDFSGELVVAELEKEEIGCESGNGRRDFSLQSVVRELENSQL